MRLRVRSVGMLLAVSIAAMIACGGLLGEGADVRIFNLNDEWTIPAAFSGALLVGSGVLAGLVAASRAGGGGLAFAVLAAFLLVMATDEVAYVHERMEGKTGVDWQLLYLPVALAGGLAWLAALRRLRGNYPASAMLVGGAVAWLVSQALEAAQWDGATLLYRWMVYPEETLEMAGSALFGLAFLSALLDRRAPQRSVCVAQQSAPPYLGRARKVSRR